MIEIQDSSPVNSTAFDISLSKLDVLVATNVENDWFNCNKHVTVAKPDLVKCFELPPSNKFTTDAKEKGDDDNLVAEKAAVRADKQGIPETHLRRV